jgi:hypothetical protein
MNKKNTIFPTEELCFLDKNIIYQHFYDDFNVIMDKFNDFNQQFNIKTDDDGNIVGLSNKDYTFFKEFYTISKRIQTEDPIRKKRFPDLTYEDIGVSEWELITFCSTFQSTMNNRLKFVVGNIGEGKSTLINYVLKYLLQEKQSIKNNILPILINCQGYLSTIESGIKKGISINDFFDKLIKKIFFDLMRFQIAISNDSFWNWYEKNIVSDYRQEIIDLRSLGYDETGQVFEIRKLRKKEKDTNEDFFIHSISYAIQILKKQIIIVFDNVDPFDIEKVVEFYWKAKNYINQSPVKIIITVRKDTFRKLKFKIHETASLEPIIMDTSLENILRLRCTKLLEKVEYSNVIRPLIYTSDNVSYKKEINPIFHLSGIIEGILDEYAVNYISKFAKKNIRNELELLRIVFKSGFLPNSILDKSLFKDKNTRVTVPPEYILSSIITFGYGTYFTSMSKKFKVPGVVNILSNSNHNNPIQIFSKLYILNFLQKKGHREEQKMETIIGIFCQCIKNMKDREELLESFKYSLYRLFNVGLLTSADFDHANTQEEFELYVKDLRISSLGNFYYETLLTSPFYLFYVKDDVYLDNISGFTDAYSVLKNFPKNRYFWENFKNLIQFLREYGDVEIKAMKSFIEFNTYDVFNSNFNPSYENLFSLKILNSLSDFSTKKGQLSNLFITFFDKNQMFNSTDISDLENVISYLKESYKKLFK